MTSQIAAYPLDADGMVRHWLACGVLASPLTGIEAVVRPTGSPFGDGRRWILNYWAWDERSKAIKKRLYQQLPPLDNPPKKMPVLHGKGFAKQRWEYAAAEEDGAIDFSRFNFTPTLMQGWLFAGLHSEQPVTLQAELLTIGPARVFLNGKLHTDYADAFSYVAIQRIPLTLMLKAGLNSLYLHGVMLGWREARLALGLRLLDATGIQVHLPLGGVSAENWQRAEQGLAHLRVKQFAFPTLPGHIGLSDAAAEPFTFEAEVSLPLPENVFRQLARQESPRGRSQITLHPGQQAELPLVTEVTAGMSGMPGENSLRLTLRPADGTPLALERDIWAGSNRFSHTPYGDYDSRRREALEHLARMPYDIPAAMAALELRQIKRVPSEAVGLACHFMEHRYDCADFYAIGLLALLHRFGKKALKPMDYRRIESAFHGFKFWLDEPGLDAMCYFTENHQVLFHVAAYLAGQLWPDVVFHNSGWTGREQMARNRPRIENWIRRRLRGNFSEWDSNAYMTLDAFAMLALAEYAQSPGLRGLATRLLDKLFFLLACQSFRGVHGSTHGRCYVTTLKSARVENTSSLQRIAWGMGLFNGETRATGLLALAQHYRVPEVIQRVGADVEAVVLTRARSRAQFRLEYDMRDDEWDVRTLTYRAPEVMLSAALDYRPGEFGIQEHLWQATLGPEAVVFTTYPGNSQEHGNARPNFWAGSARLPRVAQHERTVICLYRLELGVGMGFTHAYFPTVLFDEYRLAGQWAFARSGQGYVTLWGDGALRLTEDGRHAGQELRSDGAGEAWLCQVGRAAEDGSFVDFCDRVMAHAPQGDRAELRWTTPTGEALAFGWAGALRVNGQPVDWEAYPHYENAYTQTPMAANRMTIRLGDQQHTIDLGGKRSTG